MLKSFGAESAVLNAEHRYRRNNVSDEHTGCLPPLAAEASGRTCFSSNYRPRKKKEQFNINSTTTLANCGTLEC